MRSKTDRRICGTCEHWIGERKPIFDQNGTAKIDIIDNFGCCQNPVSKFIDGERQKDANCVHHSKWTEIL